MAKPEPASKQSIFQTVLLMTAVFLGVQLLFNSRQPQAPTYQSRVLSSSPDILKAMRDANARNLDVTIAQGLLPAYKNSIADDLKKKRISEEQAEVARVEGEVLVADTQLKGGLLKNESNRVRLAYQGIQGFGRNLAGKPLLTQKFPVSDPTFGNAASVQDIESRVIATLSERNKSDLIWGFIPGGYQLVDTLVALTGRNPAFSYAFAAFLLALAVRAVVFPLTQKQLMFSRQMSQLTPRVVEIKEKFKDNPAEMNRRTMELYGEYGINPLAGCAPAFIQMPLFLTVYQCMLHYQFEFTKGTFLWINPNASAATHGFLGANLGQQDYILVVIYGVTMVISTLLTPVTDPTQLRQQRIMGVGISLMFTVFMFLGLFPVVSGFVLYWIFTNVLSTAQSLRAYRMPIPALVKVNAPGGGVYPKGPQGKWAKMMEDMQRMAEEQQRQQTDSRNGNGKAKSDGDGRQNGKSNGETTEALPSANPPKHKPKKRS